MVWRRDLGLIEVVEMEWKEGTSLMEVVEVRQIPATENLDCRGTRAQSEDSGEENRRGGEERERGISSSPLSYLK